MSSRGELRTALAYTSYTQTQVPTLGESKRNGSGSEARFAPSVREHPKNSRIEINLLSGVLNGEFSMET